MRLIKIAALAGLSMLSAPLLAQQPANTRPPVLSRVIDCRAIAGSAERLACFDREVAALDAAEAARELVVMDRQQVRNTRRTLFGLALPDLNLFGDSNDDEAAVAQVETTLRSVSQNNLGKWMFTLADGARWTQVDSRSLPIDPRPGHKIRIRRAAMGSYLANVNNQTAVRVRRVN